MRLRVFERLFHKTTVTPELFQSIALAHLGVKNVDHHITVIQYQPATMRMTILAAHAITAFAQLLLQFRCDGT